MRDVGSFTCEYGEQRDNIVALAMEAMGRLAAKRVDGGKDLHKQLLNRVLDSAREADDASLQSLVSEFTRARIPLSSVATDYIPEAARILGRQWETDQSSFAQVTMCMTRLHDLLHLVQDGDAADTASRVRESAILLIIPPGEQHTLGAMVAAGILRRRGVSVCVRFAPGLSDLTVLLANRQFDAALITLGSVERLEICAKLVKTLKQMTKGTLGIAVGGACAEACESQLGDAGADVVTNDLPRVIEMFNL